MEAETASDALTLAMWDLEAREELTVHIRYGEDYLHGLESDVADMGHVAHAILLWDSRDDHVSVADRLHLNIFNEIQSVYVTSAARFAL